MLNHAYNVLKPAGNMQNHALNILKHGINMVKCVRNMLNHACNVTCSQHASKMLKMLTLC